MLTMPQVAVVLLNYNGKHWLQQFLSAVLTTHYDNMEVIVADNASNDGSLTWLKEHHPQIRTLALAENTGYAGGYNLALREIQAKYYVLLNTDVLVQPGWLQPLIDCMESDSSIGAAQPRIRSFHQRDKFEYAGAAGGWLDILGYPFARGRVFDCIETDIGQYNDTTEVFWASGACFCIRKDAWELAKGFDPLFFAHQEEIDLCWRLQLLGFRVMACGTSEVYHVGGGTLPIGGRKVMLNFRNNLIMLSRNLPLSQILWVIPLRWLLDVVAAWRALLQGKAQEFIGIAGAHWAVLAWWIGGKRLEVEHRKPLQNLKGVYKGLIIWKFYARGLKTFTEIISNRK